MSNSTHLKFFAGKGGKIDPSERWVSVRNKHNIRAIQEWLLVNDAVREDVPLKSALSKQANIARMV
jgi:hypothetical protein